MKKLAALTLATLLVSSLSFSSASAFSDLDEGQSEAILGLKDRGVVSGVNNEHFAPKGKVTYAQSVQMIVKGLNLNMDNLRFIKQPLASDTYTNIPDDAWYADAFIIAHYNGLEIPKDVNPNATMTREQFGDLLVRAIEKKGNFPLVKMFIIIKDEDQINVQYQGELQRLLLYKIAQLDKDGKFNPKAELTRGEAASWVYQAIRFVESHIQTPTPVQEVAFNVEKVNEDINKVTLSAELPNPGYGLSITSIQFTEEGKAVIQYVVKQPDPDMMHPQVITEAKVETYVSSKYEVVVEPAPTSLKLLK